ncbi:hypothetical protein BN2877_13640 [Achromobacter xylosoxidans]|nr:hypothetical protein BN2877_13640 [Achromobacter xylosoxidans]
MYPISAIEASRRPASSTTSMQAGPSEHTQALITLGNDLRIVHASFRQTSIPTEPNRRLSGSKTPAGGPDEPGERNPRAILREGENLRQLARLSKDELLAANTMTPPPPNPTLLEILAHCFTRVLGTAPVVKPALVGQNHQSAALEQVRTPHNSTTPYGIENYIPQRRPRGAPDSSAARRKGNKTITATEQSTVPIGTLAQQGFSYSGFSHQSNILIAETDLMEPVSLAGTERARIEKSGADDKYLIKIIDRRLDELRSRLSTLTDRVNDDLHKNGDQPRSLEEAVQDLQKLLASSPIPTLERLRGKISSSHPASQVARDFNDVFNAEISESDVLKGRIRSGNVNHKDLDSIYKKAFPIKLNIAELADDCLSELFGERGEHRLQPNTVVTITYPVAKYDSAISGNPYVSEINMDSRNYTLRHLALRIDSDAFRGLYLDIKGVSKPISDLYLASREGTGDTKAIPIGQVLKSRMSSAIAKLDAPESDTYRRALVEGFIKKRLKKHIGPLVEGLAAEYVQNPRLYSIVYECAAVRLPMPNLIAMEVGEAKYAVIDLNRDTMSIIGVLAGDRNNTGRVMKKMITENADLDSLEEISSREAEFLFLLQKQRGETYGGRYGRPYAHPGLIIFLPKGSSTADLALDLVNAERRKLNKNLYYLFKTERHREFDWLVSDVKKSIPALQFGALMWPPDAILENNIAALLKIIEDGVRVAEMDSTSDITAIETAKAECTSYFGFATHDTKELLQIRESDPQALIKGFAIDADIEAGNSEVVNPIPVKGGGNSKPGQAEGAEHSDELSIPGDWKVKENGDFEPYVKSVARGTLFVREQRDEIFFGEKIKFNVVQQFTVDGSVYQTGYIEVGGIKLHLITRKGESLEKGDASTLVITAHGVHRFDKIGKGAIAPLPSQIKVEFFAPYGYFVKDPGLGRLALSHQTMKPVVLLSADMPQGVLAAGASMATDTEIKAMCGITPPTGGEPALSVNFHDQTLVPYEQDTDHRIHDALMMNAQFNNRNLMDVISITAPTLLGDILDKPFIRKYTTVKSLACRVLRVGSKERASGLPAEAKEFMFRRLGVPAKEFEKMTVEYDALIEKKDGSWRTSKYVTLTTYSKGKDRREASEGMAKENMYYYFERVAVVTERAFSPSDNASSEIILGYIVGDERNNSLYVPVEAGPRMELVLVSPTV